MRRTNVDVRAAAGLLLTVVALTGCGDGRSSSTAGPVAPPPDTPDAPPVFDTVDLTYRLATGFVVLLAEASDPDGDPVEIACTGIVPASGTDAVRDSVAVDRTQEDQTVSVSCAASSSGLSITRDATATVPAMEPPPAPDVVVHRFRIIDLTDHDALLEDGTLTVTVDDQAIEVMATEGVFEVELPTGMDGGSALVPATVSARVAYENASHANSLRVLRADPSDGELYGERLAASWSEEALLVDLPAEGAEFELFVAPDSFDRAAYFAAKTGSDPGRPHGALCAGTDPSGTSDGVFRISFFLDPSGASVSSTNLDRIVEALSEGFPDELSTGVRFAYRGSRVDAAPSFPFLEITTGSVSPPGRHESALGDDGCVTLMRYTTPIRTPAAPGDIEAADVRRKLLQATLLPFADPTPLVDSTGAYSPFARAAVAATVAVGPDPDFFSR